MKLKGQVAIVTGSSRGIGRAVAEAFAREGARVVINSRDQKTAALAATELGEEAVGIGADLATEAGAEALIGETIRRCGRVDILVNNAGMPMVRPTLELTLEEWQRVLDLNLTGPFLCAQKAAASMLGGEGGVILNMASLTAFAPFPRRLAYAASKAALVMMTRIMAVEWAPKVRVNAIAPGFIFTDFTKELVAEGRLDVEALKRRTPQGRLGSPDEVARAAVFLASDDAGFITGETLVIDGGWLAYGFT
ncbi:MAG: 3-oxoacyl-ACP reductase FabG [Chloroflexi bacterium]|nr:MAG: 3-oxoacyl-ACP reductase FabG [Chloroflexota bacterium]TME19372.1 MAG: 3-oxoacyl-ACP reductase FabG [Chloroflexota bacterium]